MRALLAIALLLVAGCAVPQPFQPTGTHAAWSAWAGPFVEAGHSYGFIGPGEDGYGPTLRYIAMDRDGRVLTVGFQVRMQGPVDSSILFDPPALAAWRPIVAPLFANGTMYGQDGHPQAVRVVEVVTGTLPTADRDKVLAAIDDGLARAADPKPVGIADCGETMLRQAHRLVRLNCGEGDDGWKAVADQMGLLWGWLHPQAA